MQAWIFSVIDRLGPAGVGFLIALENLVPPIPSEVILPLAGFRARDSGIDYAVLVWVAATIGALFGAWILYWLGAWLGYDRLLRLSRHTWFVVASPKDVERGRALFDRHGSWIVAGARCVPVLRSLVSIPAGVARMPLFRFSLLTTAGAAVWNAIFITAGYLLAERWTVVQNYTGPITVGVVVIIVLALAYAVWRRMRSR